MSDISDSLDLEGDVDDFHDDDKDYTYLLGEENEARESLSNFLKEKTPPERATSGQFKSTSPFSPQNLKNSMHSKSWVSPFTVKKQSNEATENSFSDILDAIEMSQGSGTASDEDEGDARDSFHNFGQKQRKAIKRRYDRNNSTSSETQKKSSCMSSSEDKQQNLTREQLRELDNHLFEELMNNVKRAREPPLTTGDRYRVTFGPVDLFDLAQASLQHLIKCQPTVAFFFKRQGKFKKKKGFGYVCFAKLAETKVFINQIMRVKLSERHTEISIAAINNEGNQKVQISFLFSSSNSKLLQNLLTSGADHSKPTPLSSKASFQIEKIQTDANPPMILLLFPFSSTISFTPVQDSNFKATEPGYKGPVSVFYLNQKWLEAVLACCSDFKYDGFALKVHQPHHVPGVPKHSTTSLQISIGKSDSSKKESHPSPDMYGSSGRRRQSSGDSNESADNDISNMTRNVCAGMRDSLDKLRQMGTDDPNVQKRVLELEAQLTQLEKSLTKKGKQAKIKSPHFDPWKPQNEDSAHIVSGDQRIMENKRPKHEAARDGHLVQYNKALEKVTEMGEKKRSSLLGRPTEESRERGGPSRGSNSEAALKIITTGAEKQLSRSLEDEGKAHQVRESKSWKLMGNRAAKDGQEKRSINPAPFKSRQGDNVLAFDVKWEGKGSKFTPAELSSSNIDARAQGSSLYPDGRHRHEDRLSSTQERNPAGTQQIEGNKSFLEGSHGNPTVTIGSGPPFQQGSSPWCSSNAGSGAGTSVESGGGFEHKRKYDERTPSGAVTEDDGLHSRLEEFQKELAQIGIVTPEKVHTKRYRTEVSPDRPMHQGAPVYTEKEHHFRSKPNSEKPLPQEFYIQTTFLPNRRCPVVGCPASKLFKTEPLFLDHWDMFHKPTVTMRFCHRCTAYFIHAQELQAHLMKAHVVGDVHMASNMAAEARVKVVKNPSFRDPGRFLDPPV